MLFLPSPALLHLFLLLSVTTVSESLSCCSAGTGEMATETYSLWQVILIYATWCYHTGLWKQRVPVQPHVFSRLLLCEAWNSLRLCILLCLEHSILLTLKGILTTCIQYSPSCRRSQQQNCQSHWSRLSTYGYRLCWGSCVFPPVVYWGRRGSGFSFQVVPGAEATDLGVKGLRCPLLFPQLEEQ